MYPTTPCIASSTHYPPSGTRITRLAAGGEPSRSLCLVEHTHSLRSGRLLALQCFERGFQLGCGIDHHRLPSVGPSSTPSPLANFSLQSQGFSFHFEGRMPQRGPQGLFFGLNPILVFQYVSARVERYCNIQYPQHVHRIRFEFPCISIGLYRGDFITDKIFIV